MNRIGIYGGSFNPIHNGHIAVARQILTWASLDEIWFMVSPQNPLKRQADLLNDDLRFDLVRKALAEEPYLVPSDYEFKLPKPSYTWNTLQALTNEYPAMTFTLIFGADNWSVFNKWVHHREIVQRYDIVIYPRRPATINRSALPPNVKLIDMPLYNISSTEIRRAVQIGKPIDEWVPRSIAEDVKRYYRVDRPQK